MSSLSLVCVLLGQLTAGEVGTPALQPLPTTAAPLQPIPLETAPTIQFGEPTLAKPPAGDSEPRFAAPAIGFQQDEAGDAQHVTPLSSSQVISTSANEPLSPATVTEPQTSAAALLKESLTPPIDEALPGEPVSLLAAIQGTIDRGQQLKVVRAYWLAAVGLADYYDALNEVELLSRLAPRQFAHEQALLQAARVAADARAQQAKLAAVATQQDLADAAFMPASDTLPIPIDLPFTGAYRTNFDALFAGRTAPAGLRRIDRTIPLYQQLVEARATSVTSAGEALQRVSEAYQTGQLGLTDMLSAISLLHVQQREFLAVVRDYNFSIADYALAVAGPGVNREIIVSMLIETAPKTKSVLVMPRGVQPAGGQQLMDSSTVGLPRTGPVNNAPLQRDPAPARLVPVEPAQPQVLPFQTPVFAPR